MMKTLEEYCSMDTLELYNHVWQVWIDSKNGDSKAVAEYNHLNKIGNNELRDRVHSGRLRAEYVEKD